jgi:hypothetical protein
MSADLFLTLQDGTYRLSEEMDGYEWQGAIPECPDCQSPLTHGGSRYASVAIESNKPASIICLDCNQEYPLTRREAVTR